MKWWLVLCPLLMIYEVQRLPVSMVSAYGSTLQHFKLSASNSGLEGGVPWLLLLRLVCGAPLHPRLADPDPNPAWLGG